MIKKIDNLGRVVVPKGYRMMLGLKPGDPLDVEVDGGSHCCERGGEISVRNLPAVHAHALIDADQMG